jgi:nucleoside-diphosphate-sugar epimerase
VVKALREFVWRQAAPRIIADLAIVHASMLAALSVSVVYQTSIGNPAAAAKLIGHFKDYYVTFVWLLSPIFPIVFWMNGFYTRSRSYEGRYKALALLRGVGAAIVCFLAANFLAFRPELIGRSVAVPFLIFAGVGLILARAAKHAALLYFRTRQGIPEIPAAAPERDKVLVVGGAGYIGSLLVRRLLEQGRKVRVLDSLVYGDAPLQGVLRHPNFELIVGDCRNIRDVVASMEGAGAIIHLAAIVGDPACEQDRKTALEINYAATRMLIEIAKGRGVKRFLFASSCSVYGITDIEADENTAVHPISVYAQTKVDSETALLQSRSETFSPTIVRLATVFGLSDRPRFDLVVNLLSAKACQEGVITIYNGRQWRPFVHVSDVVEALVRILDAPAGLVSGEIFNVGDSRLNHNLEELAEKIRAVFPDTRVERVENSDHRDYRVCFDKIRNRLSFRARHTLDDGIREIKKAFEERLILDYRDIHYHNQRFLQTAGSPANKDGLDAQVMAAFSGEARDLPAPIRASSGAV